MKFRIHLLTPVNIGNGVVLSQFCDYIYDKSFVYYINHDLLAKELARRSNSDELLDRFVLIAQKQAGDSIKDRFKLKSFLEEVGLDYKQIAMKKIRVKHEIKEQIQEQAKSAGQPFIPGSSIKGAIRTALISFLFELEHEGSILEYLDAKKRENYIGQNYFGLYGEDNLKYLLVSDTMPFPNKDLGIAKFFTFNLESEKTTIPIIKEVIAKDSTSTFTIKTKAVGNDVKPEYVFLQEEKEDFLLRIINEYTRRNIEIELELLKRCKSSNVKDIKEFYAGLLQDVKKADSAAEAYLRIGSGKTFYDNTIAQNLSKKSLSQIISKNFKKADANFFPKTRTVLEEGGSKEVPGWVKISRLVG